MMHARRRSLRRAALAVAMAVTLTLVFASSALAVADVQSSGPLTDIAVGDDLTCEVTAYGFPQFFGGGVGRPGSCGWALATGGTLYGYGSSGWVSVSPATLTGTGTSQDPYVVRTTVAATNGSTQPGIQLTEVDTYVVGDESYRTDLTVQNSTGSPLSGTLYRVADCTLQGDDASFGFADPASGTVACAQSANNSPAGPLEAFVPLTAGNRYSEGEYATVDFDQPFSQVGYPNTCDCTTSEDSGMGLSWDFGSLTDGQSATFSLRSDFSATGVIAFPVTASGGQSLTGTAGSPLSATVASVSDPNSADTPSDLSASINWGDGSTSAGTIMGGSGNFAVIGSHTYAQAGPYTITVTVTRNGANSVVATDSALITSTPRSGATGLGMVGITAAGFTGSVVPGGLSTTAFFQYGLDPKYTGGGPVVYTNSTAPQPVGSDFSSHPVSASVSGLVSNAVYHVRLVATNSAGTMFGPDATFTTSPAPPPKQPPILGQTFNIAPVSGVVLVKINGVFVPLTQLKQIPQNVVINALNGTLQLITAGGGPSGARDAAAKGKKHKTKVKTQTGTFGGAIFKLSQAKRGAAKGLVTLTLVENAFNGAPSYAACKQHKAGEASAAALSSKTLQLLHASAKGKFTTKGKYGSATVRGTKWTTADRCDGTLIRDLTDSVAVTDFVRHKTIVLHAGQSYLAKPKK
jgi:hypothetical protein